MLDRDQAIITHNNARQDANTNHGNIRPDLYWNDNLANNAANWANHLASIDDLQHSSNESRPNEGENISSYSGTFATAELNSAATQWANEKAKYNGEKIGEGNYEDWGHYTQMIWPSTTSFGMAVAQAVSGNFYAVGRYSPPGNGQGQSAWGDGTTPPPASGGDGVYLVNSTNGAQHSSGIMSFTMYVPIAQAGYTTMKTNDGKLITGNITQDHATYYTIEQILSQNQYPEGGLRRYLIVLDGKTGTPGWLKGKQVSYIPTFTNRQNVVTIADVVGPTKMYFIGKPDLTF